MAFLKTSLFSFQEVLQPRPRGPFHPRSRATESGSEAGAGGALLSGKIKPIFSEGPYEIGLGRDHFFWRRAGAK